MKKHLFAFLLLIHTISVLAQPSNLKYEDWIYNQNVKTVLLYPKKTNTPNDQLNPPIVALGKIEIPLVAEFDWLSPNYQTFRVKIFHCNADWTPSILSEIEYLPEYNDYPINDYHNSFATKTPYFHYTFELPNVKVSGNYVVMVYKNNRPEDIVFSRRFMVYDNRVLIGARVDYATYNQKRRTHQQVDFTLGYGSYPVMNSREDFNVMIRQNYRNETIKTGFKPFMARDDIGKLEYQFFNEENLFAGENEFHIVDLRSTQTRLYNVARIQQLPEETRLTVAYNEPQAGKVYIETNDFDGQFLIDNYETNRGGTEADYINTIFQLRMSELTDRNIYVNGAFNFWHLDEKNRMKYNPESQSYELAIVLKQGVYNFDYLAEEIATKTSSEAELEGTHAATQNDYEIFVYHRPIGARADALVGYQVVEFNKR